MLNIERGVSLFCDIHGHSRKKNVFMYGCCMSNSEPQSSKTNDLIKLLPFMIQERNKLFSFKNWRFALEKEKENTARIVLFKELGIVNCYTLEASFYGGECLGKIVYEETESSSEELEQQNEDLEEIDDEEPDDEQEEEEEEDEDEDELEVSKESKEMLEAIQSNHINIMQSLSKSKEDDQFFFQDFKDNDNEESRQTQDIVNPSDDNKISLSFADDSFKVANVPKDALNEDENKENNSIWEIDENRKLSINSSSGINNKNKITSTEPVWAQNQEGNETTKENTIKK